MADGTRILYDVLKADGFADLPDYNTFNTALKDKGKREEVHQRLTRMYADTPKDFETFDQFLGDRPMTIGENTIRVAKEVGETVVNLPHTLQKGWSEGVAATELNRDNPNAGVIASALQTARSKPVTATEKRAATPTEGWVPSGFKENPISWLIETAASSFANMMPEILDKAPAHVLTGMAAGAAAGSAAGGVGAVPGALVGAEMSVPTLMYNSSAVQAQAEYVFGELQRRGVDVTNQQAVETALKDKKLIADLKAKAAPGAAVQGFFDGLSGMAAGKIAEPVAKKVGGKILGKAAGEGAEFVAQAGAGAAGEAGKQIATSGKVTDKQAVVAEALAETPAQAVAIRAGKFAARKAMSIADMMPDHVRAQVVAEAADIVSNRPEAPAPTADLNQAIIQQESGGNPNAVNRKSGATGIYQITPSFLADGNRFLGTSYTMRDMKDPAKAAQITQAWHDHYSAQFERDNGRKPTEREIAMMHHGGPKGYLHPDAADQEGVTNAQYADQVLARMGDRGDVVDVVRDANPVVDDKPPVDDTQTQTETPSAMQFTEAQPIAIQGETQTPEKFTKSGQPLNARKAPVSLNDPIIKAGNYRIYTIENDLGVSTYVLPKSVSIPEFSTEASAQRAFDEYLNTLEDKYGADAVGLYPVESYTGGFADLSYPEQVMTDEELTKLRSLMAARDMIAAKEFDSKLSVIAERVLAADKTAPVKAITRTFREKLRNLAVDIAMGRTPAVSDKEAALLVRNVYRAIAEKEIPNALSLHDYDAAIDMERSGMAGRSTKGLRDRAAKIVQSVLSAPEPASTDREKEVKKISSPKALEGRPEVQQPTQTEVQIEAVEQSTDQLGRPGASTTQELRSKQYEEHAGLDARTETIRQESGAEPRPRTPFYEVIPNDATVEQAKALSEGYTAEEIIAVVQDMNNNIQPHVRVAMGELVIKRLSKEYKATKNEAILEQQNDIFDWMMNYAEKTGRTLQAFSLFKSLTPEGVLHTFKRTIKKVKDRHYDDNKPDVDEILDVVNDKTKTPKEKKQKLDELSRFINKFKPGNKVARQLRPLWAKIVEAGRVGALSKEEFYNQVAGRLKLPAYDEATAQKILDLGAKIEAAKEGIQQERAIAELNKFLAQQTGFNVIDLPLGIFYGNILSGYNTSLVNIADTFLNVLSEVNTMVMTNPKAAAFIYSRWIGGYAEGRFDAALAWAEGRQTSDGKWFEAGRLMDVAEFGKKGGAPIIAKGPVSKFAKFLAESKLGTPLNAWKYVTRLLALQDAFQWRAASEARAAQLAFRMAEQQGLKGQAAIDKARDILALNDMQSLRQEAMSEGFTGSDIQARALEIRAALRPAAINTDAADFAGEATYNHKPHGLLGAVAQKANMLAAEYPGIKFIVPFTRIVANVTNRKLDWTPYGFKRAFKGYSLAEPLTGEQRQAMLIRATVGMSAMAAVAALSAAGMMTIHGNGPDDKERRRQMMSAGWKPFTIEAGGIYYSYINTPLGLGFSIIGNMSDMERYGTGDAWDIGKRGAYATLMVGSTVFSQSFLSSTATFFEALSGDNPGMSISSALSMMSRIGAGLVTPNIIRDVNAIFDPKIYRGDDLMSIMLQNTPFAAASGAKPLLNALGSPVEKVGSRFHSVKTTDPVWRMLNDRGVKVAVPGKTTEIDTENHVRMTPDQHYRYHQMQGLELYDYIYSQLPEYEVMDNEAVQEDINDWGKKNRKEILNQIREEYKQNGTW